MRNDPIPVLIDYLKSKPDIPATAPVGTLVGRNVGDITVYLFHSGGKRMFRDAMDRVDIWYDCYQSDRDAAAQLAFLVREYFLEHLPGIMIDGVQILDVQEINSPKFLPDETSYEDVYGGEVSIFFTAA